MAFASLGLLSLGGGFRVKGLGLRASGFEGDSGFISSGLVVRRAFWFSLLRPGSRIDMGYRFG